MLNRQQGRTVFVHIHDVAKKVERLVLIETSQVTICLVAFRSQSFLPDATRANRWRIPLSISSETAIYSAGGAVI